VPRGELEAFLKAFDQVPVSGYSVTLPHKEEAAQFADYRDETVERTRAANTLVRGPTGFTAYNTDYQGVVDTLNEYLATTTKVPEGTPLPPGHDALASKTVLVLGAGGIARAVAHALQHENALVTVVNRNGERAHKLAEEVGCRAVDWAMRHQVLCDMLVNCTSVGMHPNVDETPIHHSFFKPGLLVFDTVYTPETTLLIKEARARSCQTLTGVELFVRQAVLQFKLFTGTEAPLEPLRQMVRKALSPVVLKEEA